MNTYRFETNIISKEACKKLKQQLDTQSEILNWELNLEDSQRILKVTSDKLSSLEIMRLVQKAGFRSNELKPFWKKTLRKLFTKDCCS